jgi:uncharacterized protein YukE
VRALHALAGLIGGSRPRARAAVSATAICICALLCSASGALAEGSGPPLNTALPAVTGHAIDEATLGATYGRWAGVTPLSYRFQWEACNAAGEACSQIGGATANKYKLLHVDVGETLRVIVTATNSEGGATVTSRQSSVIAPSKPGKLKAPLISGPAVDGKLLSVGTGTWKGTPPFTFSYQWRECVRTACTSIAGATESTYRATTSEIGKTLRVTVGATNSVGSASSLSLYSKKIVGGPPVSVTPPTISGIPIDGQTLTLDPGTWAGTPPYELRYQWLSCSLLTEACSPIAGATGTTYQARPLDVGNAFEVEVTAKSGYGIAKVTSPQTNVVQALLPSFKSLPKISGLIQDGQLLSAVAGVLSGTEPIATSLQWQLCSADGVVCNDINGAVGNVLSLISGDIGSTVRVVETATNSAGSVSAASEPTSVVAALLPANVSLPSIEGLLQDGQKLTAALGSWTGSGPLDYSYQWELCNSAGEACKDIEGAGGATLGLISSLVGDTVRVVVSATNGAGTASATSEPTSIVKALLPSNTSLPSIGGLLQDGQTLTAVLGSWTGSTPLSYSYQWQQCNGAGESCKNIEGAAGATLGLISSLVGDTVRVVVTATNPGGSIEAASTPTSVIGALLPGNTSLPSIGGLLQDGQTLTAALGSWTGTAPISYGYQWLQCNAGGGSCKEISGATGTTLGLISGLVGDTIRLAVTATNSGGSTQAISEPTNIIKALLPGNTSLPSISGLLEDTKTLTASAGSWSGTAPIAYGYQWQKCNARGESCENLEGATGTALGLISSLVGDTVRVVVTATNSGGSTQAASAPTSAILALLPKNLSLPAIGSGGKELEQGAIAKAATGGWEGTAPISYSYQWKKCNAKGEECQALSGETAETLSLGEGLVKSTLQLVVKATNARGSTETASAPTSAVLAALPVNEVIPTISTLLKSGGLKLGEELLAHHEKWGGTQSGTSYSYQWQLCGALGLVIECKNIAGATKEHFLLELLDVGLTLRVGVKASNERGAAETVYSKVTGLIAGLALSPSKGSAGTAVLLKGAGVDAAKTVNFGGTEVQPEVKSPTEVVAEAPAGTGTVPVTVSTEEGTTHETTTDEFTYTE